MVEINTRLLALVCGLLFIIGIFAAMAVYPGGYDFWGYYISTLGEVQAKNGADNLLSRLLFLGAMSLGAVSLVVFWLIGDNSFQDLTCQFNKISCQQIISIGSAIGLIATPFMILIAIFPLDICSVAHSVVTIIFFGTSGCALLVYSVGIVLQQLKDRKESTSYLLFSAIVFVLTSILVGLMVFKIISIRTIMLIVVCALVVIFMDRLLDELIDYLSYVSSIFIILLIIGTLVLFLIIGFTPQLEISFVWGMVIWNLIHLLHVWDKVPEERKPLRKSPRAFLKQVKQNF
ncbi:MAG: hypothetical protein ACXADY_25335 [Candidatus Hodarchaeales archaeon]|jgi:hypothetical protein